MSVSSTGREFGVVIPATSQHFHWLRGTCASIRYFMGETPICVLLDDDRVPEDLPATYGVQILRREDVEPKELRDVSFGSHRAKIAALWAAPFETYLLVDCDTVVWGDLRRLADFDRFDFVLDAPGREPLGAVMDIEEVERSVPLFDARAHVGRYVNTGAYFARRGMVDLGRYLDLVEISSRHPGMLLYGDQGFFNLLVFWALDEGGARIQQREIQAIVGRTPREDLVRRFGFRDARPAVVGDPAVIHWAAAAKPSVRERGRDYFAPMTYFRLAYRADAGLSVGRAGLVSLRFEDARCADRRAKGLGGRIVRTRNRTRRLRAQVKVRIRRRIPDRLMARIRGG